MHPLGNPTKSWHPIEPSSWVRGQVPELAEIMKINFPHAELWTKCITMTPKVMSLITTSRKIASCFHTENGFLPQPAHGLHNWTDSSTTQPVSWADSHSDPMPGSLAKWNLYGGRREKAFLHKGQNNGFLSSSRKKWVQQIWTRMKSMNPGGWRALGCRLNRTGPNS